MAFTASTNPQISNSSSPGDFRSTPTSQSRGSERSVSNGLIDNVQDLDLRPVQPQRNVMGSSPLERAQVSERMVGYLKAALDAVATPPATVDDDVAPR